MSSPNVTAACHCGANVFSIVPVSARAKHACHCMACRKSTGVPFNAYVTIQDPLFPPEHVPETIRSYKSSPWGTRYFCANCGAHIAMAILKKNSWHVTTGTLDRVDEFWELSWHEFVKDTGDGGITRVMKDGLDRWSTGIGLEKFVQPEELDEYKGKGATEDVLKASCRCGGVKEVIKRPSAIPDSPFTKVWGAADGRRWIGGHCFCSDCRLTSGFPLVSWICVGKEHVHIEGQALQTYESSPGMERGFCGTCGACVSFEPVGQGWICLPVALFDVDVEHGEGVAAVEAEWVDWENDLVLCFPHEGRERNLVDALTRGLKGE